MDNGSGFFGSVGGAYVLYEYMDEQAKSMKNRILTLQWCAVGSCNEKRYFVYHVLHCINRSQYKQKMITGMLFTTGIDKVAVLETISLIS